MLNWWLLAIIYFPQCPTPGGETSPGALFSGDRYRFAVDLTSSNCGINGPVLSVIDAET